MITSTVSDRRHFLKSTLTGTAVLAAGAVPTNAAEPDATAKPKVRPILLSCKLGMIAKEAGGKKLSINERLLMAAEAGFDGVDFDEAGSFSPKTARAAVRETGVFVHNAIDHTHWSVRLTDPNQATRDKARANMDHCLRVSHAAGETEI